MPLLREELAPRSKLGKAAQPEGASGQSCAAAGRDAPTPGVAGLTQAQEPRDSRREERDRGRLGEITVGLARSFFASRRLGEFS
jgi:hypothetical protein